MIVQHARDVGKKESVGGKASGLFELKQAGLRVPDFVVLPTSIFADAVIHPESAERISFNTQFRLSKEDQDTLFKILENWNFPNQAIVVRSSVADEDGEQNAFPGMMDSFLNLKSKEHVLDSIVLCAQSAFSLRSKEYRKQKGLTHLARPAVIIQKQIEATASGVLFTTSPDYPQEISIHAVPGFSEAMNQGNEVSDEFYLWKHNGILHRQVIASKEYRYRSDGEAGLLKVELIAHEKKEITLSENQLEQLYRASRVIENHFSSPQDVEFVFSNEELFIVQARPITQPIPEVIVYDNSNIQESYCGVTTPLTFSFAKRAYATVYKQTMHALALPSQTIRQHEHVIQNLLGLVKGRIYYNINSWYRGLQLLPSFKQNKADMEKMMGLTEPVDFIANKQKSLWEKCKMFPGIALNLARLLISFWKLDKSVGSFLWQCNHHYTTFYKTDFASLSLQALYLKKSQLDADLLHQWTIPIINDFYVMMTNGKAFRDLKKVGIENVEEFLSRYLSDNRQLASMQPTLQLKHLAGEVDQYQGLREIILELPLDIHDQTKTRFYDFYKKVLMFIEQYGDRTIGELKLETVTMRVNPFTFYKYLRNFVAASGDEVKGNSNLRTQAINELKHQLSAKSFLFRKRVLRNLRNLEHAIGNRESLRLERTRLFGMYRTLYLAIGEQFQEKGWLELSKDIFYLTEDEILEMEKEKPELFKRKVKERKQEFNSYRKEEVASRVIIPFPPTEKESEAVDENFLFGTGCYPGVVEGEAIVITDPEQDINAVGKIICAVRTDPGWAALFPSCKGVLIEKGSSLSHSVILLRELGIPTIINIPRLTQKIKSGQRIKMNTSEGKIDILNYASN